MCDEELTAMFDRFLALASDWMLEAQDLDELLALRESGVSWPVTPPLPKEVEHRMRLVLDVGREIGAVLPPAALREWLHDEVLGDGSTPLQFMAGGLVNIRAMLAAARGRP